MTDPIPRARELFVVRWTPKGETVNKLILSVRSDGKVFLGPPLSPDEARALGSGSLLLQGEVPSTVEQLAEGLDVALRGVMFLGSELARLRTEVRLQGERLERVEREKGRNR